MEKELIFIILLTAIRITSKSLLIKDFYIKLLEIELLRLLFIYL